MLPLILDIVFCLCVLNGWDEAFVSVEAELILIKNDLHVQVFATDNMNSPAL